MYQHFRLFVLSVLSLTLMAGIQFHNSNASSFSKTTVLPSRPAISAQQARSSNDGLWLTADETLLRAASSERLIVPTSYRVYSLNQDGLTQLLGRTPMEFTAAAKTSETCMTLPMPDGGFARFRIEESPIMVPELAAQFPGIKTYSGQGIDDPTAALRFDRTPAGFHAMVLSARDTVYVDPYQKNDTGTYISYFKHDYHQAAEPFRCLVENGESHFGALRQITPQVANGTTLRTYRLALAATGEYTTVQGGTVDKALAAMTTTMNRVNGIYIREVAVRMVMVAQEASIIYTDPASDPYSNNNGFKMLDENQANLDKVVGNGNYDIGHVFSTGGGGIAGLGVVCTSTEKALGVTGSPRPTGDGFDVDYVAHEMGHQFGAQHPFNGTDDNCGGGNRAPDAAYEPGSGSTIMAYAGICGTEDLQPHSDDYFHTKSLEEITNYINSAGNGCAVRTATNNNLPTVKAGSSFTIPQSTPFTLTATGSDPDSDAVTYCWEEYDLGLASPPSTDNGNRPLFRSFNPTASPSRTFPQPSDIMRNTTTFGEVLPTTNRTMNFRVTIRDNRAGGGAINSDQTQVTVSSGSGPFVVTEPVTAVSWTGGTAQTVKWEVANTASAPVNCANVKISLSTDGGLTFPTVLIDSTPNDGAETITAPNVSTSSARIKVEAVGNIFFDISNANFTITPSNNLPPTITAAPAITEQQGGEAMFTIATVSDKETPSGNLTVTTTNLPSGLSVTQIANTAGTISATVATTCTATVGQNIVGLQVKDAGGLSATANLMVNVTANTPPTLGTYSATTVTAGDLATITPSTPPTDGGKITVTAVVASGTFAGTLTVDAQTGVVTITNAGPVGSYTVTVTATDGCQAATTQSFALTVNPLVKITGVSYDKKVLTINGVGFGTSPTLTVNGTALPASVILSGAADTKVAAKGKTKKLNLHTGTNTIQVTGLGGQKSNVFTINLAIEPEKNFYQPARQAMSKEPWAEPSETRGSLSFSPFSLFAFSLHQEIPMFPEP